MSDLSLQPLLGRWLKTNESPQWIRALDVWDEGGRLRVRVDDWGEAEAEAVYAGSTDSREAAAFVARFQLPDYEVDLEANVNLGLLVVAALTRPREGNPSSALRAPSPLAEGRRTPVATVRRPGEGCLCGQFTREFFYRSAR